MKTRAERYAELVASPYHEAMNRDRRECVQFLRSDLFRLDPDEDPPYDCLSSWRYVAPGGAFKVTLTYGERHLTGHIERKDGTLVSATGHADVQWLEEHLP